MTEPSDRRMADQRQEDLEKSATQTAEADAFYRMMVESAIDFAMFTLDMEGAITFWNSGAERLFGFLPAEIVGKDASVIFTPEDTASHVPTLEIRDAIERGRAIDERWHMRKDGTRFWADGVLLPLRDSVGRVHGFLKILRDATAVLDLKIKLLKAEEEAQLLRQQLGT